MGQLAASDSGTATRKTSSLDRLKLAASRFLKRAPKPSAAAAIAPSSPPPAHRDYATRGGKGAARSLARLSATSMASVEEEEAVTASSSLADGDSVVGNAVPFPRRSRDYIGEAGDAAKPSTPADVVAGRFWLGLPRDLEAKYDLSDKVLGSGGSGVVRLATSKHTGKTVAVKTIPKVSFEERMAEKTRAKRSQRCVVSGNERKILSGEAEVIGCGAVGSPTLLESLTPTRAHESSFSAVT